MNETELARLIATLEHLKHPFDRKQIGKLPATDKRPELEYVNHAHVTNRLNQYAPDCSWVVDEMFTLNGACWIRGTMTIYGSSRVEFGTGKTPLEAMSHFIRRAAMRFGVATDLWAKEDFEDYDSASAQSSTLPARRTGGGVTGSTPPSKHPAAEHSGADSQGPEATGEASDVSLGKDLDTKLPRGTYLSKDDQALLRVEFGSPATALKAYRARFGERITRLADITYEMRDEMTEALT